MTWADFVDFLKGWGALVLAVLGLALGLANRRTLQREHGWKATDREQDTERSAYCLDLLTRLKEERVPGTNPCVPVSLDKLRWAKWGEREKLFRVQERAEGWCVTFWYED